MSVVGGGVTGLAVVSGSVISDAQLVGRARRRLDLLLLFILNIRLLERLWSLRDE